MVERPVEYPDPILAELPVVSISPSNRSAKGGTPERAVAVAGAAGPSAADVLLEVLAARGVRYLFANAGTDFPPLVEACAKALALGTPAPHPVVVPHENLAVAMAHGYAMATGRGQAVMVHVGMGTANSLNGFINASRQNVPLLLMAGRTPHTESGRAGGRNNAIHWPQEHFDQGGMLREFAKWDYELRDARQMEAALDRALAIAHSAPAGPVYLTLPREVLAESAPQPAAQPRQVACAAQIAQPAAVEAVAKLLAGAEKPLLITANAGRTAEEAGALRRLAEALAIPVVHHRPRHLGLPTTHPLHAGWDPHPLLPGADLILVVDCDVPWIPQLAAPGSAARVVHIAPDPLFTRYPMRGFQTDFALAGNVADVLEALRERAAGHAPAALAGRRAAAAELCARSRAGVPRGLRPVPAAITVKWASACVNELLQDPATVVVNEYPLLLEELDIEEPGRYFGMPAAGGLGWGLGAALGAKLADPARTVICAVGDGAYMFGNPTPAHFVSRAMGLPVLWILFNNARWAAVHRATLSMYPGGYAARSAQPPFATLEPSPAFEKVLEASGGYGVCVREPAALRPALERALDVVRREQRQALVNVLVEPSYAKPS